MLRSVAIYYAKTAVFIIASYGLLLLVYGRTGITLLEWAIILFVAFTIGYVPTFVRSFRGTRK